MENSRALLKYRGSECLNCKQPLDRSDKYCSCCGQLNSTKKLSFDDFFNEFFSGIFAYDSRFHRTLRALMFQPGKISKDYIQGKRMRYANPFRFYLSASILFFLIYGFSSSFDGITGSPSAFTNQLADLPQDSIRNINRELARTPALRNEQIRIDSIIREQHSRNKNLHRENYIPQSELDTMRFINAGKKKFQIYSNFYQNTLVTNAEIAMNELEYNQSNFNHWLYKKAVDWNILKNNPSFFFNYFISKLPFIIFFYLPVFALFIWLIYIRRPFNYMEHLIFTFHVQTAFFVLYALALLVDYLFPANYGTTIATLLFLFYLYKALRKFYAQSRVKTIVKFVILNLIFFTLATVATIVSLLASFAVY